MKRNYAGYVGEDWAQALPAHRLSRRHQLHECHGVLDAR